MDEYEIPLGNPVIVLLAMKQNGMKFEIYDGERQVGDQETDGERTSGSGDA